MSSEAQSLANRRNAQRSTGPRTIAGKEVVSQNAVKHGLSARRDVIRGEDAEEFERHRQEMLEDLAPAGAMESILAMDLTLGWAITRDFANSKVLEQLLAYEGRIEGNLYKAMAELAHAEGGRCGGAKQSQFAGAAGRCRHE